MMNGQQLNGPYPSESIEHKRERIQAELGTYLLRQPMSLRELELFISMYLGNLGRLPDDDIRKEMLDYLMNVPEGNIHQTLHRWRGR